MPEENKRKHDETDEVQDPKPSSAKTKPATKKKTAVAKDEEPKNKKARKDTNDEKSETTQNQTETDYSTIDFTCTKENAQGKLPNFKISSWNVGGIKAWIKKKGFEYISCESPEVLCLQETKCSEDNIPDELVNFKDYKTFWRGSVKEGYAGVALFSKEDPISVEYGIGNEEFDKEGRCITAQFEHFYVVNVYVPNAGRGLVTLPKRLEWNRLFNDYITKLDEVKPVVVCGDMNVAHSEIDLTNPKTNQKNAGFTPEERAGFTEFLADKYVDTFRSLYPDKTSAYTFWSYMRQARAKDIGWRLDYFVVSKRFMDNVCDNIIRTNVYGSDHCPITLFLNI